MILCLVSWSRSPPHGWLHVLTQRPRASFLWLAPRILPQVLVLRNCAFDMVELVAALSRHTHLRDLVLCPGRCTLDTQVVADLLLTLCQQSASLRRLMLLPKTARWYEKKKPWDSSRCHVVRKWVVRGLEEAGMGGKVELKVDQYGPTDDFDHVREEEEDREE